MDPRLATLLLGLLVCFPSTLRAQVEFVRGDCNANGELEIADASWMLVIGWFGGPFPSCWEACDFDDDGSLGVSDGILALNYLFLSGEPPAPPFPACGADPTPSAGCDSYDCQATPPAPDPSHVLSLPEIQAGTGATVAVPLLLDTDSWVTGWSAGVSHDPWVLELLDVVPGADILCDMEEPHFFEVGLYPDGWTAGSIPDFLGYLCILPPGSGLELAVAHYQVSGGAGDVSPLQFTDSLGDPPVATRLVVFQTTAVTPTTQAGSVTIEPGFRRGDVNADGVFIGIGDAIFALIFGFAAGPQPPCLDSADFNDDGQFEPLSDGIGILSFAFAGGPPPPAPGLLCGHDPTPDALGCESYEACP